MSDKMREAAEQAYTMTAHDYCANPVGSRDWTLFWRGWQAALAEQPAQGERFAADDCNHCGGMGDILGEYPGHACPSCNGTGKVDAPPAPAVPDDVAKDAARYRWLRDQKDDDGCVIVMKEKHIPRFVNYRTAINDYIDAAMLAAAPEVAAKGRNRDQAI